MRDGWRRLTLGEVCEITKGNSPTLKTPPGPYPLIVTGRNPGTANSFQFEGEAVCIPLVSSTGHGHASLKRVHYASGRFAVANIIAACVPYPASGVNVRFLFHYLQHLKDDLIVTRMKGTANVSLSVTNLAQVPVALPPLDEQRRMVDLILAVEDAIEAAEADASASRLLWRSICDAVKSGPGSTRRRVAELVTSARSGGTPSRTNPNYFDGDIPWLKSGEVRGRAISASSEHLTSEGLSSSSAWIAPAGSVLVAMYGGGTVGQVGQLEVPMATNQAVLAITANEVHVTPRMLYHLMASESPELAAKAVGAAQANISKRVVLDHQLGTPPAEDQNELTAALDAALDSVDAALATADALRTLRSNLLTVLLSGEHEIPASYDELLEVA